MPRPLTPSPEFLDSIGKKPDGAPKAKEGDKDKPKSAAAIVGTFVAIVVGVVWWAAMARALGSVEDFELCRDESGTNVLYDLLCVVRNTQAWEDTMAVWEVVADAMDWLPGSEAGKTVFDSNSHSHSGSLSRAPVYEDDSRAPVYEDDSRAPVYEGGSLARAPVHEDGETFPPIVGMLGLVLAPLVAGLAIVASGLVAAAGTLFSALDNASDGPLKKTFLIGLAFLCMFPVDVLVSTFFTSLVYLRPFAPGAKDRAKLTPGAVALVVFGLLCAIVNAVIDSTTLSSGWRTVLWLVPLLLSLVFSLLA